jgi:hypothetical protein
MAHADIQSTLDRITREAQEALGGNLSALVLYGSHARGEAQAGSDINLLFVVKDSRAAALQPLLSRVPGWLKSGATSPVIFEVQQLQRSLDTFALELAEMACAHSVLFGEDPFAGFTPDWAEIRNEIEKESRQKTIFLKRTWLASGGDPKLISAVLTRTVPGYLALLRGTAHLRRRAVESLTLEAVIADLSPLPWFKPEVWRQARALSKSDRKLSAVDLSALLLEYIEQAREFVRYIDTLDGGAAE